MPTIVSKLDLWTDEDGSTSKNSSNCPIGKADRACFEFEADGTLVGTVKVQATNDTANYAYKDVSGLSYAINVGGGSTGVLLDIPIGFGFTDARLVWTRTSGTGNLNANYVVKDDN